MSLIKKIPMAVCAISLSLASLGNLLLPYGEALRYACGVLSAILLALFALKLIIDFKNAKEEMKNPVVLSVMPTSTMALMLLSAYIRPFAGLAALCLWYAALAAHILLMLLFIKRFILNFKLQTVFPSWFIVCAGIAAASVSAPAMDARFVGQIVFYIGLALYLAALPLVIYRMVKAGPLPEPARPTTAIFAAPMSLLIAGYFASFETQNAALVYIMAAIALISYIYVTISMFSLLRLKFYPTCAAFTFPYVISAIAFKALNAFFEKNGVGYFSFLPEISKWLAVAIVIYVLIRYMVFCLVPKRA